MSFRTLTALLGAIALAAVAPRASSGVSHGKELLVALSWGDQIGFVGSTREEPLLSAESFRKIFRQYKEAGTDVEDGIGLPNLLSDLDSKGPLNTDIAFGACAQFLKSRVDGLYVSAASLKQLQQLP